MVPVHDNELAQQDRWAESGWQNYELWEKTEQKIKKRKRSWIFAAVGVFIILSAIPIFIDHQPKWVSLSMVRKLAQEVNLIKRDASLGHLAYRIRFPQDGSLTYTIEKAASCTDSKWTEVRSESLASEAHLKSYILINPKLGSRLGIFGLTAEFCYDYLSGSDAVTRGESLVGFGVLPVKDLTEHHLNHLSTLILSGPSAEISFE